MNNSTASSARSVYRVARLAQPPSQHDHLILRKVQPAPWLGSTKENTNGLVRQGLPTGTDLQLASRLDVAADQNNYPYIQLPSLARCRLGALAVTPRP